MKPLDRYLAAHRAACAATGADAEEVVADLRAHIEAELAKAGLSIDDIDLYEVNEAFAPVPLAWAKHVGADPDRLNVNGGAIALGHPLGMSGARIALTAAHHLAKFGGKRALASMCVGVGQGVSLAIEKV